MYLKKFFLKSFYLILLAGKIDFAVGGQALIEGVMMRSPNHITIAVRKKDGSIIQKQEKFESITKRFKFLGLPLIRGVVNLFEMMIVGTKALNFSANESIEEEEEASKNSKNSASGTEQMKSGKFFRFFEVLMFAVSLVVALGFSLALFKFLPLGITEFIRTKSLAVQNNYVLFNVIDGVIKTTLFVSYIFLIGLIPSFKRVFQYHGAEHKSIFTYENNLELNPENAKTQSRFHPRCGTSFVIIVFAISIIVYSFVPRHEEFFFNFLRRVAFLPLVAGIAYEVLKLSAKYTHKMWIRAIIQPGLLFQRLTTKEPDKAQLEVGLKALTQALTLEKEIL